MNAFCLAYTSILAYYLSQYMARFVRKTLYTFLGKCYPLKGKGHYWQKIIRSAAGFIVWVGCCCGVGYSLAQESKLDSALPDSIFVQKVQIFGNNVTKDRIILRELAYGAGRYIPSQHIDSLLKIERNKVFNLNLFKEVEITYRLLSPPTAMVLNISVEEQLYLWPRPILEPADRSLSEWLNNRGADLSRLNYGLNLKHNNIGGRRERLSLTAQLGFLRRFSLKYEFPFIDRKQQTSLAIFLRYEDNNTVSYITSNHIFVEAATELEPLITRRIAGFILGKRYQFFGAHRLEFRYEDNRVKDTIPFLNPNYFLESRNRQQFLALSYQYEYDRRDISRYPLKGYYFEVRAQKLGMAIFEDINMLRFDVNLAKFFDLGHRLYFATGLSAKVSFPELQPYVESRALGYEDNFIRGLDNFVVEGQHIATVKNTFRWKMMEKTIDLSKFIPIRQINRGALAIYPKTYADFGYIHNPVATFDNQALSNRMIWGGGVGADLVLFHGLVFRFEYSFSFRGEQGFFFQNGAAFR